MYHYDNFTHIAPFKTAVTKFLGGQSKIRKQNIKDNKRHNTTSFIIEDK